MRTALVVLAFLLIPVGNVFAVDTIPSLDAVVTVQSNATIEVTERILYDFGTEKKHGIFRTIPYSYQAGTETYTADISSVVVTDEAGAPIPFNESRGRGMLTIKIGDPTLTLTGQKLYVISYIVQGPFLYFDDSDEFYWNVTGAWENDITRASVLVNLPPGAQVSDAACYQGSSGSTTACSESQKLTNTERAGYLAVANTVPAGGGFTVAVSFPKGTIAVVEKPWESTSPIPWYAYTPLLIPLGALFMVGRLWYTRGRDPKGRVTIVPEYTPPPNLSPALAGIIYNERIEPREISAEIVRLAVDGYIRIHHVDQKMLIFTTTDYLIERVVDSGEPSDLVGKLILEKLFQTKFNGSADVLGAQVTGTLLSKMRHEFIKERDAITDALYAEVLDRGYFIERPDKVRNMYVGVSVATGVIAVIAFVNSSGPFTVMLGVSFVVTCVVVGVGAWIMPARTVEGVRLKEYLEGFKRYLDIAEKDRIAYQNPTQGGVIPEKNSKLFASYLPYAMAFGVEKKWAEQFEGIHTEQPSWYTSNAGTPFAAGMFASDLGAFATDFTTASAPQSSGSHGGGSVGGGFGGGGGGSW